MARERGSTRPRLGISACLLGQAVRYDGGHRRDGFLADTLAPLVTWVPVCPEVECGLPTPREPMHLEGEPAAPRLVVTRDGRDLTAVLQGWAARRVEELADEGLRAFVLKARSPSCGLAVGVLPAGRGPGLFARALRARLPGLELLEEGDLASEAARAALMARLGL